jgi:hypothetical protein
MERRNKMIKVTFFCKKAGGEIVYGLFLHNEYNDMSVHCGNNLEKAMIMYEELTEKPSIAGELLEIVAGIKKC